MFDTHTFREGRRVGSLSGLRLLSEARVAEMFWYNSDPVKSFTVCDDRSPPSTLSQGGGIRHAQVYTLVFLFFLLFCFVLFLFIFLLFRHWVLLSDVFFPAVDSLPPPTGGSMNSSSCQVVVDELSAGKTFCFFYFLALNAELVQCACCRLVT